MTLRKACEILKIDEHATQEEALRSYEQQKEELRVLRMEPGNVGNAAAKKLDLLDEAYNEFVSRMVRTSACTDEKCDCDTHDGGFKTYFEKIEQLIKANDLDTAQEMLDDLNDRSANWHYLQSVIYYKKSWFVESKKQLEMCINLDPNNPKYKDSLEKLNKIMASKTVSPDKMSGRDSSRPVYEDNGMPNNGTCTGSCCGDVCLANMCCDCCSCLCRGL